MASLETSMSMDLSKGEGWTTSPVELARNVWPLCPKANLITWQFWYIGTHVFKPDIYAYKPMGSTPLWPSISLNKIQLPPTSPADSEVLLIPLTSSLSYSPSPSRKS